MVLPSGRGLRFKKQAYFSLDDDKSHLVLVNYIGNEQIAVVEKPQGKEIMKLFVHQIQKKV